MAESKRVWRDALDAAKGKVEQRVPDAEKYVRDIADAHKKAIASLLAAFADGKIDEPTLEGELSDEKLAFEGELLAVEPMTKKVARDAAKAFFDVIDNAVAEGVSGGF